MCPKTLADSAAIAAVISKTIQNRVHHVHAIDSLIKEEQNISMQERAADLLELVQREGVDNSLQRLVSPDWAVYVANDNSRFMSTAFWGQVMFWMIFGWFTFKLARHQRCCCSKKKLKQN